MFVEKLAEGSAERAKFVQRDASFLGVNDHFQNRGASCTSKPEFKKVQTLPRNNGRDNGGDGVRNGAQGTDLRSARKKSGRRCCDAHYVAGGFDSSEAKIGVPGLAVQWKYREQG